VVDQLPVIDEAVELEVQVALGRGHHGSWWQMGQVRRAARCSQRCWVRALVS
jgi:hypothetical protein